MKLNAKMVPYCGALVQKWCKHTKRVHLTRCQSDGIESILNLCHNSISFLTNLSKFRRMYEKYY